MLQACGNWNQPTRLGFMDRLRTSHLCFTSSRGWHCCWRCLS